jgi:hypothetical protein
VKKKKTNDVDTVSDEAYNAIVDMVSIKPCPESGGKDNDQRNA